HRKLHQTSDGPLFSDYVLDHLFEENRRYQVQLRCYHFEPYVEITENFSLGMNAELELTLNPQGLFDSLLSHRGPEFESDAEPIVDQLGQERPEDLLCRLQIPVLSEYFVPN